LSDFLGLFSSLIPIAIIVLLFLWVIKNVIGKQSNQQYDGATMILEVNRRIPNQGPLFGMRKRMIFGFSPHFSSKRMLANVSIGYMLSQHGSQITIALQGNWNRIDQNAIRGNLYAHLSSEGTRIVRDFNVGQELPISWARDFPLGDNPNYAKIIQVYVPGDVPSAYSQ